MPSTASTPASPIGETPLCLSCGLPGELWTTQHGAQILLESNDPAAPLRASDVPEPHRWIVTAHLARRLSDVTDPSMVCQVAHAAVCPRVPQAAVPLSLLGRRALNQKRLRRATEPDYMDDPFDD